MANSDKNIRITPNRDTTSLPRIAFTGSTNAPITLYVLDDNTISFEGSSGQLFSVNNNLSSGYIFSINDISGIPSFRVHADGTVGIAEFSGFVGIGTTNPAYKLSVIGQAYASGGFVGNLTGTATSATTSGSAGTSLTAGSAGTSVSAGTAGTATNAGSAGTSVTAGSAGTATNAGFAGAATTATSAGTAGTATNAGFAGAATTATSAGTAGTATNAGSAGTSVTAGSAGTAVNAGSAGSATTATSAGTAGTATNAGSAGTSVTSGSSGSATTATSAGTAGTATNAGSAGSATTATSAGTAGTATNAGSAGTATNSANTNVVLDTTSTIYLTGSRSNTSIGSTAVYVLSGVSALGNTITATTFSGNATTATSAGTAGTATNAGSAGTSVSAGTAGTATNAGSAGTAVNAGSAGTSVSAGTAGTATNAGSAGTSVTAGSATTATSAGTAGTATNAGTAGTATNAGLAGTATVAGSVTITSDSTSASRYLSFVSATSGSSNVLVNSNLIYNPGAGQVLINSSTASTSVNTGALVVNGGVGISGKLVFNSAQFGTTGIASPPTMAFIGSTGNPINLRVLDDNTISFSGTQGQLFSISPVLNTGWIFSVNDISGIPLIRANADATIAMAEFAGNVGIGLSNPSYKLHVLGDINASTGYTYRINGTRVLDSNTLGTGVINSSLTSVGTLTSGTWNASTIGFQYGGTGYTTYTKGDLLVGTGSSLLRLGIGTSNQILRVDTSAATGLTWSDGYAATYGAFYSTTTQQVTAANTATVITFNGTYESNKVNRVGGGTTSRIQIVTAGIYNVQFSAQINLVSGNQPQKGDIWFRVNGNNVPQSNTLMSISGKDYETVLALNFVSSFSANDYVELVMSSSDLNFSLNAKTGLTSPTRPDIPSVILSVTPVVETVALAGVADTGIFSINGLNQRVQYIAIGSTGSLPNIVSDAYTHTINLPIAGTAATGLLTSQTQTIGGDKTFANNVAITGNLTINGTTTTVNSTVATIVDPVITLGGGVGNTNPSSDDNKDRGIEFKYFSGTAKTGFFGFDDSTGFFTFIPDSTNTSEAFAGTVGVIDATRITGSASSWTTARTLSLSGDLSGSVTFDGTGNTTLNATIAANSVALGTDTTGNYVSDVQASGTGISIIGAVGEGATLTVNSNATSSNTVSTIVARDSSGNFSAGTITATTFSGNATTATTAGSAGTSVTAGTAGTATNAGFAGAATTATSAGTAGTATNAGSAGTSVTAGSAGTATNAGSAGTATVAGSVTITADSTNASRFLSFTSATSGSSNILTNSNLFYNPSAGQLVVNSSTASTSVNTGALVVNGGVGISGRLVFNQAQIGTTGITTIPSMAFIGQTGNPIFLNVLEDNSLSFDGAQGQLFSITPVLNTGWIFSVNDISGIPLIRANADATIAMAEFAGNVGVGLSNPSYKLHVLGDINASTGYTYRINGTKVLDAISLGTSVVSSSLTSVGTLASGTWNAATIGVLYGGTGQISYTDGQLLIGSSTGNSLIKSTLTAGSGILITNSAGSITVSTTGAGITNLNGIAASYQSLAVGSSGTDFAITSTGSSHTFNIPDASATARGLITTGTQTIAGTKTFSSTITGSITGSAGSATTATTAGAAGTATNAGSAGTSVTAGSAGTATNAGSAGTSVTAGTAGTATNAGSAGTSVTAGSAGSATTATSAGTAGTATNAGSAGSATTATSAGTAGTATNAGSAGTATNSANTNVVLDTTSTIYLTGSRSNTSIGSTAVYVLSGVSALGNTLSASGLNITGSTASTSSTTGALIVTGGAGIAKTSYFGQDVVIQGSTASTSPTTGALVVTGGVGIGGTLNTNNINIAYKIDQTPLLGNFNGGTGWTNASLLASGTHRGLAFGNGIFVSVRSGSSNVVSYSSDGRQWTTSTMPFIGEWFDVIWGKDKFVAVASAGSSGAYSSDGISWTSMNMPSSYNSVTYGNGKFVAVGNTAAYSTDGITWSGTAITSVDQIAYGNGTFVAVRGAGPGAYSYDGVNWNNITTPTSNGGTGIKQITYGNGYFVIVSGITADIDYSTDGVNWSTVTVPSSGSWHNSITYGNGVYTAFNYGDGSYSYDAINWFSGNSFASKIWWGAAYGNNRFIANNVSDGTVASIDGPTNTLNLYPKFTGDIDNVRIGAIQPASAEFTNLAAQKPVRFTANTTSTNTNTGALVVVGGVGVGKTSYFGQSVVIQGSTASGSTTTGALTVSGGVGIGGSLQVFGTIDVADNIKVLSQKEVRFFNSANTFYTGLKAGSPSANVTFTLPIADGSANQVLYTNGSAALGWTSNITGTATSAALVNTDASTATRYLVGTVLNTASGSTQLSTGSGITIGNNIITANTFSGNATTATSAGTAGTATNAGSAGTSVTAGSAGTAVNAGSAGSATTATNAGFAGAATTATSAGTAGTATNAGSAGSATTATNAGSAGTSVTAGSAGTATNTANANIVLDTTSTIYITGSRSNASIGSTAIYVLSGVSALGNTITATTFSGNATTSTTAGSAGTAVNAGSAGSATTATNAGTAGTATNAGSAGTSVTAGSAGTAVNAGSAGSATTATNAGTAGTATNAGSAGTSVTAGSATTATNAGSAGTATNAGSAATSTNSANTNIVLDTTSTIFLTGSRSNASIGNTAVYVLSGVSALGNTITATTFSGNATTATNAGSAGSATTATSAGTAGTATNAGSAGTSVTAGSSGSATTATSAGTAGTATNAGFAGAATTATSAGTAGTATNAGSAGSATTATNAGTAGTATNAGSAGTAVNAGSAGTAVNAGRAEAIRTQTFSGTDFLALLDNDNANATTSIYAGSGISVTSTLFVVPKDTRLGSNTNSTTSTSGALIVSGGLGVTGNLNVGGNFVLTGDLTVNGTTTTVNSTVSTVVDPIITIGTAIGGTVPNSADSKDRGVAFYYVSGTGKTGFFGWDQSVSKFALFTDATISGEVVSGTKGVLVADLDGNAGSATTSTSAGTAGTATNAGSAGTSITAGSSGSATTATSAGTAGTATNAGSAGTSVTAGSAGTSVTAGSATTATNAGFAGAATTATSAGTAGTATNAGSAGTSVTAGSATTATSAGTAGTATNAGSAGTATNAGSAATSTNSANTNVVLDTTSTIYLTGSRSNASIGSTPSYVLSGVSALGNTLSASGLNITGSTASTNTTTGALVITGGVGIGGSLHVGTSRNSLYTAAPIAGFAGSTTGAVSVEILNSNSSGLTRLKLNNDNGNYLSFDINSSGVANANRGIIEATAGLAIVAENSILNLSYSGEHIFDSGGYCLRISGSGVSVVLTDASTSSTSGALTVSGGAGIALTSYFGQDVKIQGTTASTSTSTGALVVSGGVGIGGSLWTSTSNLASVSGVTHLNGAILSGAWAGTAISAVNGGTGQVSYAIGDILYASSTTALTRLAAGTAGSVLKSNGAGTAPSWQVDSTGSGGGGTVASGTANQVAYYASTGASVSGAANLTYDTTSVIVANTTASNNNSSGALLVYGGIGASGQISGAGASFTSTVYLNGIRIGQGGNNINILDSSGATIANFNTSNGWFRSAQTTQSINTTTGALVSAGGLGVAKAASIGETIYGYSTVASTGWSTGGLILSGGLGVSKTSYINGDLFVTSSTVSSSTSTGALVVTGGVGIGGSLWTAAANLSSISGVTHLNGAILSGAWAGTAISAVNGGTGQVSYAIGDILYASSTTALTRLAAGTAGSVLKSNGAGTAPSWQVDSTGSGGGGTVAAPSAASLVAYYPGTGASVASYNRVSINTAAASMELLAQNSLPALLVNATNGASVDSVQFKSSFGDVYWALSNTTQSLKSTNGGILKIDGSGIITVTAPGSLTFYNSGETFYTSFIGAATANTTYTLPPTSPATGTSVLQSNTAGVLSWVAMSSGGAGTVAVGTSARMAYYPGTGSSVKDATGFEYSTSGTTNTVRVYGGSAIGNTFFIINGIGTTQIRVGIGVTNPAYELEIEGEISATNKSFVINHPLKNNWKLRYGSLEGPENGVYVRGILKDEYVIETPDYWTGLVHPESLTVTLTPIGKTDSILYVEKIEDYKVFINDFNNNPINCFFTVWAERIDIPKLVVEYENGTIL